MGLTVENLDNHVREFWILSAKKQVYLRAKFSGRSRNELVQIPRNQLPPSYRSMCPQCGIVASIVSFNGSGELIFGNEVLPFLGDPHHFLFSFRDSEREFAGPLAHAVIAGFCLVLQFEESGVLTGDARFPLGKGHKSLPVAHGLIELAIPRSSHLSCSLRFGRIGQVFLDVLSQAPRELGDGNTRLLSARFSLAEFAAGFMPFSDSIGVLLVNRYFFGRGYGVLFAKHV